MVNLGGRDVEGYINQVKQRIAREIKIPPGYVVEFGGEFKNFQAARARLMLIVPVALALIFVLMFFVLNSVRQSFLVFTGIPFAISGGVFALYLRGLPFSIPAAIGFIALSGVAVLNGLVLVSYFNQVRLDGASLEDTVFKGGLTRLRPDLPRRWWPRWGLCRWRFLRAQAQKSSARLLPWSSEASSVRLCSPLSCYPCFTAPL